ncbi:asparagine synthase-related protein [Neobacillus sp. OS1-33]|uniref:asparagine synthase-related protein n=1 Tax=Neobacillus sp. OS1-33 TaxID=3070683 RepID=UPI0027DEB288|nr:asparagine synthase-related protein [Neobacillus sp. OS1-33]WML25169.1 asparagine synthase-related protein [Neobacillus sp. OS1-33]
MSAITGIYHLNEEPLNPVLTNNLMQAFQQYPADRVQTWNHNNIFLGCHAQWITPESIGERLPYYDYEKRLAITADAIIDNRDELFDRLQVGREERKAIPDSQLILIAYYKWGEEVPKHLIGDFSFMIWDEKKRKLFGARDFSGARTLYFYHDQSRFAFSTTIEPLFKLPYVAKILNEEWLAEYLAIPGMVEAADTKSTAYKSIYQIPPSHSITIANGKVSLLRYKAINFNEKLKLKSNGEYEEAFQEIFQKAVTSRIRTYGKVGSQLSGGLDSGSVVSFAAKALQKEEKQLHTFSYIPEESFIDWTPYYFVPDERPFIKETVNYVGNINDQYLDLPGKSPLTEVDDFLSIMEMPYKFFDNSFWLKAINEQAHKEGIKILLNGARGNYSISWGSRTLTVDYYASLLKKLKWIQLYHDLGMYCKNFKTGKSRVLPIVTKKAFPMATSLFVKANQNEYQFPMLVNPEMAARTNVLEKLKGFEIDITGNSHEKPNEARMKHFNYLYSWNKSGTASTKLSLKYSLWDRDPTNDLRIIRFCLAIPDEQYVNSGMERSLIRRATKNYLPDKVRLNQHSRGIQGADVINRMQSDWPKFMEELNQLIKDARIADLLNLKVIKDAINYIGESPRPEYIFNDHFRILTRSLVVYRFIKSFY